MQGLEIWLHPSAVDDDEDLYFAEIQFLSSEGVTTWVELYLQERRARRSRVMARMWVNEKVYRDFPYDDVIGTLGRAKAALLEGAASEHG